MNGGYPMLSIVALQSRVMEPYHPDDVVGLAEIAERLGVQRQTANVWRTRELMPPERGVVSGNPWWRWRDIVAWAKQTGRWKPEE